MFIDDLSIMTWIYFLRNKREVLSKVKQFKREAKGESGMKVKCLRSDNGLEYAST